MKRGRVGTVTDIFEHAHASLEILLRDLGQQLLPKRPSSVEDVLEHRGSARLEMHGFAPAIFLRALPRDPAILLQTVQDTNQGRLFNADARGDFVLGQLVAAPSEMGERGPFPHAQAERLKALIELCPPGPSRLVEKETKFFATVRH
ncbi:MAG: hypothetical protein M3Q89_08045 [Verrucomicrobiota bacterium]|nr:hypothetical protein [Verrucomicrobiota bacterium]